MNSIRRAGSARPNSLRVYRAVQIQATRRSKNRPSRRSLAQNVCHSNIIQDRALEFFGLAIIGARRLHSVAAEWPEFGPPSTYGWRSPSRTHLAQPRAARETARASAGDEHAAPNCASPPLSDPSGSHRHVTPVLKKSRVEETPYMDTHGSPPSQKTTGPKLDGV